MLETAPRKARPFRRLALPLAAILATAVAVSGCGDNTMATGDWVAGPLRDAETAFTAAFGAVSSHTTTSGPRPEDCRQLRETVEAQRDKPLPKNDGLSDAWLGYIDGWAHIADACEANDTAAVGRSAAELTGPIMDRLKAAIEAS